MYGRYANRLLLVVAKDGGGRILLIVFAITLGESGDDWDFFLSRLRRHICPQPNICVIQDQSTRILATIERQGSLWHRTHHRLLEYPFGSYELCRRSVQNRIHVQRMETCIPTGPR
ncbi:hypothetical protein J1N35_044067 [Gossypium stocksii]|uniref:MULE transposase domain-containing protein n=1 Tax=Gossypium stocksii TaxID=47602 RepID=A0A9D3U8T3_9ROSI|nr:hypothetical protein J1N35_044067 [Gossypium stocksii]